MITIDKREESNLTGLYKKMVNSELKFQIDMLHGGDYILDGKNGKYVIESMTKLDEISKIKDRRLWEQARKCLAESSHTIFLINVDKRLSHDGRKPKYKMNENSIMGAEMSVMDMGVSVYHVCSWESAYNFIEILSKRVDSDSKNESQYNRPKPKNMTNEEQAMMLLTGLQGVGTATARKILSEGSLYDFAKGVVSGEHKMSKKFKDVFETHL